MKNWGSNSPTLGTPVCLHPPSEILSSAAPPTTTARDKRKGGGSSSSSGLLGIDLQKWKALFFICFLTFGSNYSYDFPGALGFTGGENSIAAHFAHQSTGIASSGIEKHQQEGLAKISSGSVTHVPYTHVMNQMLYTVQAAACVPFCLLAGYFIDNVLGLRRAVLLASVMVLVSNVTFALGIHRVNFTLMVIARVIHGASAESLGLCQCAAIARWFSGGEGITLAFGVTIIVARGASTLNFLFSPRIASSSQWGVEAVMLCGVFICVISVAATIVFVMLDVQATQRGDLPPETRGKSGGGGGGGGGATTNQQFRNSGGTLQMISDILRRKSRVYWLGAGFCVCIYSTVAPLTGVLNNLLQVEFNLTNSQAGKSVSCYMIACAMLTPVVGAIVDKFGRVGYCFSAAGGVYAAVNLIFFTNAQTTAQAGGGGGATSLTLLPLMILMGVGYASYYTIWAAVPQFSPKGAPGISFGILAACGNSALVIVPLVMGIILDAHHTTPTNSPSPVSGGGVTAAAAEAVASSKHAVLPDVAGFQLITTMCGIASLGAVFFGVLMVLVDRKYFAGILSASPERRRELLSHLLRPSSSSEDVLRTTTTRTNKADEGWI